MSDSTSTAPSSVTSGRQNDEVETGDEDIDTLSQTAEYEIPAKNHQPRSALAIIAILVALGAAAGTAALYWQYRQFYVALATTDEAQELALERVRADLRASEDIISGVTGEIDAVDRSQRALENQVSAIPGQLAGLQQRIDATQGGSFDVRAQWLRGEAEYYLGVANVELQLGRRYENARLALELADDRLQEMADPAVAPVRALIADEFLALGSIRLVDVEGLAFSLSRLGERAEILPLRLQAPSEYQEGVEPDQAEPGITRLWQSIKGAFGNIVSIERRDEAIVADLSADEQRLVRRQLGLELQVARTALVRAESELFQASLNAARALLVRDFATESAEVEGALALIDELLDIDIAPQAPDISRSLNALRALGGR